MIQQKRLDMKNYSTSQSLNIDIIKNLYINIVKEHKVNSVRKLVVLGIFIITFSNNGISQKIQQVSDNYYIVDSEILQFTEMRDIFSANKYSINQYESSIKALNHSKVYGWLSIGTIAFGLTAPILFPSRDSFTFITT